MSQSDRFAFDVVEVNGTDGCVTPTQYPRALYYARDGGLVLFARDNVLPLRMDVEQFAHSVDGRAVALGRLWTMVVLVPTNKRDRSRYRPEPGSLAASLSNAPRAGFR